MKGYSCSKQVSRDGCRLKQADLQTQFNINMRPSRPPCGVSMHSSASVCVLNTVTACPGHGSVLLQAFSNPPANFISIGVPKVHLTAFDVARPVLFWEKLQRLNGDGQHHELGFMVYSGALEGTISNYDQKLSAIGSMLGTIIRN